MARTTAHPLRKYQVQSSMVCDFDKKEKLLEKKYKEIKPYDYYKLMFGADYGKTHLAFFKNNTAHKTLKFVDFTELFIAAHGRDDVNIHPCSFYKNTRRLSHLNKLYAITIDLDNVEFTDLRRLIAAKFHGLIPTAITNSGGGVHLVYLLTAPIDEECRLTFQPQIKAVLRAIREVFRAPLHSRGKDYPVSYKVDRNPSIMQGYRVVGSATKLGFSVRAYRCGEFWDIEKLAEKVGITWKFYQRDTWEEERRESNAQWRKKVHEYWRTRGEAPAKVAYIDKNRAKKGKKAAGIGLWNHCEPRMCEVQEGNRHYALFALCVVAGKCGVELDLLIKRLEYCRDYYNRRDRKKVRDDEVTTALDGYDPKWANVSAKKLEEWFGWEFPRENKRNGRTQAAHLQKVANDKVERTQARIAAFLAKNPDASKKKVAEALGMSRNTVAKYYT